MKRLLPPALIAAIAVPALLAALALAAPPGSTLTIHAAPATAIYGFHFKIDGHLKAQGVAQPGVVVHLFAQRFPFHHSYRSVGSQTTSATGGYVFRMGFPLNVHLKAVSDSGVQSGVILAPTLPRLHLTTSEAHSGRSMRITLAARSPGYVHLGGRVVVYLDSPHSTSLRIAGHPQMNRVATGLSKMSAVFSLPASWRGGFRVGTCYSAPQSTGMYEPGFRCPHRYHYVTTAAVVTAYRP
jgi:hypothetical protein